MYFIFKRDCYWGEHLISFLNRLIIIKLLKGLTNAITRCSENIRSFLALYIKFLKNPDEDLPKPINSYEIYRNISDDKRLNKTWNIFNTRYSVLPSKQTYKFFLLCLKIFKKTKINRGIVKYLYWRRFWLSYWWTERLSPR